LQEVQELLSFRFPEKREVEVVLVELPDKRIVARTREELERVEKKEEGKT